MKDHIIVGFGRWGKVIFDNIKDKIFFRKIYIKSRKNNFVYETSKKTLLKINNNKLKKRYYSGHICTPVDKHFIYAKNLDVKKLIIEKPTFKNLKQYSVFSKKKNLITNYSDLFSPGIKHFYKYFTQIKKGEFKLTYRNLTLKYKKNYECLNDWLDHPLSLILFFFREEKLKFKIEKFERNKINKHICENIEIIFFNKKFKVILSLITNSKKKKRREIEIKNKYQKIKYNFFKSSYRVIDKKTYKTYNFGYNSIINLYENFIMKNNMKLFIIKNFSRNIFIIKRNIINSAKKIKIIK